MRRNTKFVLLVSAITLLSVDTLFAMNDDQGWGESCAIVSDFRYTQNGGKLFSKLLAKAIQTSITEYFDADSFVGTVNEKNGHEFLSCILAKSSAEDATYLAKLAGEKFEELAKSYNGQMLLKTMVDKHASTREVLRAPTISALTMLVRTETARDFVRTFASSDELFAQAFANMSLDTLVEVLKSDEQFLYSNRTANLKLIFAVIDCHPKLATVFSNHFIKDDKSLLIGCMSGKLLFARLVSNDPELAKHMTSFDENTVSQMLSSSNGREALKSGLRTVLSADGDFFSKFTRPLLMVEVVTHQEGSKFVAELIAEEPKVIKSLREFATEYFGTFTDKVWALTALQKLAEKDEDSATQFATQMQYSLDEFVKSSSGRVFIVSVIKNGKQAAPLLAKVANVEFILEQKNSLSSFSTNGIEVLLAICNASEEAVKIFRERFSNCYSPEYVKVKKTISGETFLNRLAQGL